MRLWHNTATARRRWLFLAFPALAALALTLALVSHASAAPIININTHVPFSGLVFDPCIGANVTLSGDDHVQAQVSLDEGGGFGEHAHIHENVHLTGTDDQGNTYIANEEDELVLNGRVDADGTGREEVTQPLTLVEVSQGAAPNFTLKATLHMTINADGTLTAEVIHLTATCQG